MRKKRTPSATSRRKPKDATKRQMAVVIEQYTSELATINEGIQLIHTKLTDHDRQFAQIHQTLDEHSQQFAHVYQVLDEHSRQFEQIHTVLVDHSRQFIQIDHKLDQKAGRDEFNSRFDTIEFKLDQKVDRDEFEAFFANRGTR